jgi:hypothetical protein
VDQDYMYYDSETGCYTGINRGQTSRAKLPSKNNLRYLDLSGVGRAGDQGLEWKILASCQFLEKVSLADCWGKMSEKTVESLVQSCPTLTVLDLQNFDLSNLPFTSFEKLITSCGELTELNLNDTKLCSKSITFLSTHLTEKIKKISLCNVRVSDQDLKDLVIRCNKIVELDLYFCKLLTNQSLKSISGALHQSLAKLWLPNQFANLESLLELRPLKRLKYLYCTAITTELKLSIKKNYFSHVTINEKREKAWSKIADSTPSGNFDRIWEISCLPFEYFPKKFKDSEDQNHVLSTKKRNKNKDGPNDNEIIEEDLENDASESEYEYESENESEYGEKISSDFEYESDTDAEQSDIDSDCERF